MYILTFDNILNIIALLILSGIAISALSGNNGILKQTVHSKFITQISNLKEEVDLALTNYNMENININYSGNLKSLLTNYNKYKNEFIIQNGILYYLPDNFSVQEQEWLNDNNISGAYTLQVVGDAEYAEKFWEYKSSITKIEFQNSIEEINNSIKFDISENEDNSIIAQLVLNEDNTTYSVYIQTNGCFKANEDMSYWFYYFDKLTELKGLEYLYTLEVTNMDSLFSYCRSLTSINVKNFNTSNVTNMDSLFSNCKNLEYINLSNFNTKKVTNMSHMFESNYKLKCLDLSNFDTKNVIKMYMTFGGLTLEYLDLSNFDISNVSDARRMFVACSNLRKIVVSELWDNSKINYSDYMFDGCINLVGENGTVYNSNYVDKTYARIDKEGEPGYLSTK